MMLLPLYQACSSEVLAWCFGNKKFRTISFFIDSRINKQSSLIEIYANPAIYYIRNIGDEYAMGATAGCGTAVKDVIFGSRSASKRINAPLLPMLSLRWICEQSKKILRKRYSKVRRQINEQRGLVDNVTSSWVRWRQWSSARPPRFRSHLSWPEEQVRRLNHRSKWCESRAAGGGGNENAKHTSRFWKLLADNRHSCILRGGKDTSWERINIFRLLSSRKRWVTSGPKERPTPRFDGARPFDGWGSLQSISHMSPLSGGCCTRSIWKELSRTLGVHTMSAWLVPRHMNYVFTPQMCGSLYYF